VLGDDFAPGCVGEHGCMRRGRGLPILDDRKKVKLSGEPAALRRVRPEVDGDCGRGATLEAQQWADFISRMAEPD